MINLGLSYDIRNKANCIFSLSILSSVKKLLLHSTCFIQRYVKPAKNITKRRSVRESTGSKY